MLRLGLERVAAPRAKIPTEIVIFEVTGAFACWIRALAQDDGEGSQRPSTKHRQSIHLNISFDLGIVAAGL